MTYTYYGGDLLTPDTGTEETYSLETLMTIEHELDREIARSMGVSNIFSTTSVLIKLNEIKKNLSG